MRHSESSCRFQNSPSEAFLCPFSRVKTKKSVPKSRSVRWPRRHLCSYIIHSSNRVSFTNRSEKIRQRLCIIWGRFDGLDLWSFVCGIFFYLEISNCCHLGINRSIRPISDFFVIVHTNKLLWHYYLSGMKSQLFTLMQSCHIRRKVNRTYSHIHTRLERDRMRWNFPNFSKRL